MLLIKIKRTRGFLITLCDIHNSCQKLGNSECSDVAYTGHYISCVVHARSVLFELEHV